MNALVVDDDIVSRLALTDLLAAYGVLELAEAADGQAAWALLEQGLRPVICFFDVHMPHLSGLELLARMKAHPELAAIPVVLVSSATDRGTMLEAIKLEAAGYILKPLQPADARSHLEKIFRATLDRHSENPEATMQRLQLPRDRLAAYFAAFAQQLASARDELRHDLEAGRATAVVGRLAALRAGCLALGLWELAGRFGALRLAAPDAPAIAAALTDASRVAAAQSARLGVAIDTAAA